MMDSRMLGRTTELARVAELLQTHRFVTIAGPGGMGKTTLARAVVAYCAGLYPDGVRCIDLAVLADGRDLASALGAALGIARLALEVPAQLAAGLRGQRLLVFFDCCEHHAAATAHACEALLRAAPGIDVLCTSREPLLAHGERIVRLGPIALPDGDSLDAAAAPAVALFVARAHSDDPAGFILDAGNVALVCKVCRAVEGVPLALELAAALVRPLGLRKLARRTSRRLLAPVRGAAVADHRHRTLASMLDWSYDALTRDEQRVLRSLAVFRGQFTLEAAGAVAGMEEDSETVVALAGKSLVSMHADGAAPRARLLDVTRAYVLDKLGASGTLHAVQARHAHWLRMLMARLERDWMDLPRDAWLDLYSPWVDDVLAAIDWALGPGQEPVLGAQLAGVGFSLGDQMGVARAFQHRLERAAAAIVDAGGPPEAVAATLLRLNAANPEGRDLSARGLPALMEDAQRNLQMAQATGVRALQASPLTAMWGWPWVCGDYPASLTGAVQMVQAAEEWADPHLALIGQRTMAQSLHYLGRHAEARRWALLALAGSELRIPLAYQPSPVRIATSMRIVLARILWMEGAADQALAMSAEALVTAESDRPVALCQALCLAAIPVAIWCGDLQDAARMLVRLREHAEGHGLGYWLTWANQVDATLAGIADAAAQDFSAKCGDHLVTFAPGMLAEGAIARCTAGLVGWCAPEMLRARAIACMAVDPGAAGGLLVQGLALAEEQGALGWALRCATSLAALYRQQGRSTLARSTLAPVLGRCREGKETFDVRTAAALLAAIG